RFPVPAVVPPADPHGATRLLHSFPTRRSSDLADLELHAVRLELLLHAGVPAFGEVEVHGDRNISHRLAGERLLERLLERLVQARSEEHTSALQSRENLVCRLLL